MVTTVLRLRYRILGNTLARNPWQLVGFCFGVLWGLSLLGLVVVGMVLLGIRDEAGLTVPIVVIAGSALVVGWVVGPLLIAGMDTTVDAAHLAPLPLSLRQVMLALTGTGLTGIPGLAALVAALATPVLWWHHPAAAVVAVPTALAGVVLAVLSGRLVATLSTGLGSSRRGREIVGTLVLIIVIMIGPIVSGIGAVVGDAADAPQRFTQVAGILGWTPIGAAWAVPAAVAAGSWWEAAAKLIIAVLAIVVVWIAWRRALESAIANPPRQVARQVKPGALGLFGRMPSGGVGATWARSLTAWLKDPRYLRQLIFVPLFPVIFAVSGGIDSPLFLASPIMVALLLAIAGYADISYDGTAFASVISSGIRGWQDRLGRVLGAASVGIPAIVAVSIAVTAVAGAWTMLPAVLGGALGLLLAGYAVSTVSSALLVAPVAAAGDSPFRTVPGQTFLSGLMVFVVMAACGVCAAPSLVPAVIALATGSAVAGYLALALAVVVGVGLIAAGTALGGRLFERTAPDLLARIKAFPTS